MQPRYHIVTTSSSTATTGQKTTHGLVIAVGIILGFAAIIVVAAVATKTSTNVTLPFDDLFKKVANNAVSTITDHLRGYRKENWSYDVASPSGPPKWGKYFPNCSSVYNQLQSPIDILPLYTWSLNPPESILFTEKYSNPKIAQCDLKLDIIDGRRLQVTGFPERNYRITGEGLDDEFYSLTEINIHYGCSDTKGSEHSINGSFFPLELQLMHKIVTPKRSIHSVDSNALSILLQVSPMEEDSPALKPLIEQIEDIINYNRRPRSLCLSLGSLVNDYQDSSDGNYYRYLGSETTPPCKANVFWHVFKTPQYVSRYQLRVLRQLHKLYPNLKDNFRPTQGSSQQRMTLNSYSATSPDFSLVSTGLTSGTLQNIKLPLTSSSHNH